MSRPLPRWVRLWLPLAFVAVAAAAGIAALTGGEPEPLGPDTRPIPATTSGRDGPLSFEVHATECGFENVIAAERVPAEGQFCLVEVTLGAAVAPEPTPLDLSCQYLVTDAQERYLVHEEATRAGVDPLPFDTGIRPGGRRDLELTFDIPTDARAVGVELHAGCDSEGIRLSAGPSEAALDSGTP
jgi:hypothetical protein